VSLFLVYSLFVNVIYLNSRFIQALSYKKMTWKLASPQGVAGKNKTPTKLLVQMLY